MASGRFRRGDPATGIGAGGRRGRGLVMFTRPLPRYVISKLLKSGSTAFYFNIPTYYRKLGCTISNEPLGNDYAVACGEDGNGGRAFALNALFDEWDSVRRGQPVTGERAPIYGTVDWLFGEYKQSKAYLEKVAPRSRPDYERTMLLVSDLVTKKGDRLGQRKIKSITPVVPTRFMKSSLLVRVVSDCGKEKRS